MNGLRHYPKGTSAYAAQYAASNIQVNHPWMLNILCAYPGQKINLFLSLASVSLLITTSFFQCGLLGGGWWVGRRVSCRYNCSTCCKRSSTTTLFTSSMAVCCSVAAMTTVITSTCKLLWSIFVRRLLRVCWCLHGAKFHQRPTRSIFSISTL